MFTILNKLFTFFYHEVLCHDFTVRRRTQICSDGDEQLVQIQKITLTSENTVSVFTL